MVFITILPWKFISLQIISKIGEHLYICNVKSHTGLIVGQCFLLGEWPLCRWYTTPAPGPSIFTRGNVSPSGLHRHPMHLLTTTRVLVTFNFCIFNLVTCNNLSFRLVRKHLKIRGRKNNVNGFRPAWGVDRFVLGKLFLFLAYCYVLYFRLRIIWI